MMSKSQLIPITWLGDSLEVLRSWPDVVKRRAGEELFRLQIGHDPRHWRSIKTVGKGVREIKISEGGELRIFYLTRRTDGIIVLHAFGKKGRRTSKSDIAKGKQRLKYLEAMK